MLRKIADPVVEPVSLTEAKLHLRVTVSSEDALIQALITAARTACEERLGRALIATAWQDTADEFPECIRLQRPRLIAVQSLRYVDTNGTTQTLATTDYQVVDQDEPARVVPAYGKTWPATRDQAAAVSIAYTSGYAAPVSAFDTSADTVTLSTWRTLAVGDPVVFSSVGGTLPTGITAGVTYYVQAVVSAGVYKLTATPGGSVIDLAGTPAGSNLVGVVPAVLRQWILLAIGELYENRERSISDRPVVPHEFVDGLLDTYRIVAL